MFSDKFNQLVNIPHVRCIDGLLNSGIASFVNLLFSDHVIMMRNVCSEEFLRQKNFMGQKALPFFHSYINFSKFQFL